MALTKEQQEEFDGVFPLDGEVEYFEPPQPLIEGLITQREFTIVSGQPKVGKSTFGAHFAYSVATETDFFGRKVMKSGPVVYLALERAHQTQQRINKLIQLNGGLGSNQIHLVVPAKIKSLQYLFFNNSDVRNDVQLLIDHLTSKGITEVAAFVVDSLENSINGSDSQQSDAGPWCNGITKLIDHYDASALVLHHDTKSSHDEPNSNTAYSGSRVFLARSGGWIRALSAGEGRVRLKTMLGNYGNTWDYTVTINDFGLYEDMTPEQIAAGGRYTQSKFVTDLVREALDDDSVVIYQHEILETALADERNSWPSFGQPQLSTQWRKLVNEGIIEQAGDSVDGRSDPYKRGPSF